MDNCVNKNGQLLIQAFSVSAGAGLITNQQFTVPTGRGDVTGVAIIAGAGTTDADLDAANLTLNQSGVNVIQDTPLLFFSKQFQNAKRFFPVDWAQASTFNVILNNTTGAATSKGWVILYFAKSEENA